MGCWQSVHSSTCSCCLRVWFLTISSRVDWQADSSSTVELLPDPPPQKKTPHRQALSSTEGGKHLPHTPRNFSGIYSHGISGVIELHSHGLCPSERGLWLDFSIHLVPIGYAMFFVDITEHTPQTPHNHAGLWAYIHSLQLSTEAHEYWGTAPS